MRRAVLLVLSGNVAAALLNLARNLLVARLIPVADYGIAATLLIALAVVEMASALGLQQQVVQAKDGDDPRLQAALQGFQVLRGVLSGLVLLALAGPLARFMGVPEAAWGYRAVAAVPVLAALVHFDVHRLSRHARFGPMALVAVLPPAASLLAVWPLAQALGDWRTMLGAILLQWLLAAPLSHLLAERPYRLALSRAVIARSLAFGWPLLLNGALLFVVFNGDRVVVGRELGMVALGLFSMGVTLTLTPTLVLDRSVQSLFLPRLSAAAHAAADGARAQVVGLTRLATEATFAAALALPVGAALLGAPLVHLVLGERYAALPPLLTLLAAAQALRVARAAPNVLALAHGRTGNAMAGNLARAAALPVAWWAVAATGELLWVLWIALAAEAAGYAVSALLARRSAPGWLRATLAPHLGGALLLAGGVAHAALHADGGAPGPAGAAALLGGYAAFLATLGALRGRLRR